MRAKRKRYWVTWNAGPQTIVEWFGDRRKAVQRAGAVAQRIGRPVRVGRDGTPLLRLEAA